MMWYRVVCCIDQGKNEKDENKGDKLYQDLSKSRFTRTISNPEMVMKRQRQKKLEQMERFKNRPHSGQII